MTSDFLSHDIEYSADISTINTEGNQAETCPRAHGGLLSGGTLFGQV